MTFGLAASRRPGSHKVGQLLPCLVLAAAVLADSSSGVQAQTLTTDLLRPVRNDFASPQDNMLRKTDGDDASQNDAAGTSRSTTLRRSVDSGSFSAQAGLNQRYGSAAASGAAESGYDSYGRKRKRQKFYPGQRRPKVVGPGSRPILPAELPARPAPPSSTANKAPVAPAIAGTIVGQPQRKRLKADNDPFGPVGDYAGSFLVKSALELSGGYDTNPGRLFTPRGSAFYTVAPELMVTSDWERHALVADLRGSYIGYGRSFGNPDGSVSSAPTNLDHPDFLGHIDGRVDVSNETHLTSDLRMRIGIDNPGSPNIQAGLARYPLFTSVGTTLGIDQSFNRLNIAVGGMVDRTTYQNSVLTDGSSSSNDDRNFNQYGGVGRISYDWMPGVKPFAEIEGDTRVHDTFADRFGFMRDSDGGYVKAGSSFELSRILTGEFSVGYAMRSYADPRLSKLQGLLTSAALTWSVTPLTTAKFYSNTSIDESTLAGVPGVLTRTYTGEVDHDFQRWLTGVGKFTYGTQQYQDSPRFDRIYSLSADLIFRMTREFWVKATLRRDWLNSNIAGASSASTVALVGVRLQN